MALLTLQPRSAPAAALGGGAPAQPGGPPPAAAAPSRGACPGAPPNTALLSPRGLISEPTVPWRQAFLQHYPYLVVGSKAKKSSSETGSLQVVFDSSKIRFLVFWNSFMF